MSKRIKCLIVDDEPLARELLERHVAAVGTLDLVASCPNALKAFEILNGKHVDLIFLDIQMPVITGLDFLKSLKHPPAVILTTAFRDYAIAGYELDVLDYLLKPITFDRFFKAIGKYKPSQDAVNPLRPEPIRDFIYLKSNKKNHKIFPSDILYVESLKDYSCVHTTTGELSLKQSISDIETLLRGRGFLRIHRSFLINTGKITAFTAGEIEINGKELPVGSSYRQLVSSALSH